MSCYMKYQTETHLTIPSIVDINGENFSFLLYKLVLVF